jgi:hypothetical protein
MISVSPERRMLIAKEYGERLATNNLRTRALTKLVEDYPCHEFVIDKLEAESLFSDYSPPFMAGFYGAADNVEDFTAEENALADMCSHSSRCSLYACIIYYKANQALTRKKPQKPAAVFAFQSL